jgi:hypothetical protein
MIYHDGQNPTLWCSIGVICFKINQFRDALDAYSHAIWRINPYIPEVWFDLGSLYRDEPSLRHHLPIQANLTPGSVTTSFHNISRS